MKKPVLIVLFIFLFCGAGFADNAELPRITVYGTATKEVIPDVLKWRLTAKNAGGELQNVAKQHTRIVEEVILFLKRNQIGRKEIQTTQMVFRENIVYRNGSRIKEGYIASTDISFKVNDLKKYQSFWIGLSGIKELNINSVSYDHSKRIAYQNETRLKALHMAKTKAETLANAVGSQIGEPLLIEEFAPSHGGLPRSNLLSKSEINITNGEGIAPGTITIQESIKIAFRLIAHDK